MEMTTVSEVYLESLEDIRSLADDFVSKLNPETVDALSTCSFLQLQSALKRADKIDLHYNSDDTEDEEYFDDEDEE